MIVWGIDFANKKRFGKQLGFIPEPNHDARVFRIVCGGRQLIQPDTAPSELWPYEECPYIAPDGDCA